MQPMSPSSPLHLEPCWPAMLGGFCQQAAEVLMVLCLALNYFPDCHCHVLASSAGCDPAEPNTAAAAGELMAEACPTWSLIIGFLP